MCLLLVEKGLDADELCAGLLMGSTAVDVAVIVNFNFLWKQTRFEEVLLQFRRLMARYERM
jgi:hypothetical protein